MTLLSEVKEKIEKKLSPYYFELEDESYKHRTPAGTISHLRLFIVAEAFEGLSLVEQHQLIYKELSCYLNSGLKALGLTTKTPENWQKEKELNQSPACLGKK